MPGLPIPFKEFVKNPVIAVLYICLIAIGYLYFDLRHETRTNNAEQKKEIAHLTVSVDLLKIQLQKADSTVADLTATFRVLKQLGKVQ